jgi:hypothetical protein
MPLEGLGGWGVGATFTLHSSVSPSSCPLTPAPSPTGPLAPWSHASWPPGPMPPGPLDPWTLDPRPPRPWTPGHLDPWTPAPWTPAPWSPSPLPPWPPDQNYEPEKCCCGKISNIFSSCFHSHIFPSKL